MKYGLLIALCAVFVLSACVPEATLYDRVPNVPGEVLYHDVFLERTPAIQVHVFGIGLGYTEEAVRALHGEPFQEKEFVFGRVKNLEYDFTGSGNSSVVYHVEQGIVTGMLLTQDASPLLVGETVIDHSRANVYGLFGQPTVLQELQLQQVMVYNDIGYEVYIRQQRMDRVYFTLPNRAITGPGKIVSEPELCAQVLTPAISPEGECVDYQTPCDVPQEWEVVDSCP